MSARRALVLQNQLDAPPALLGEWSSERHIGLEIVRADVQRELPGPEGFHFAVALGSNASAADRARPWVAAEIEWLREADRLGLPVLGICFGAQVLAVALGGGVQRSALLEIGWVVLDSDHPELVAAGPWFAWHEDAIELPPRAREIARNAAGTQAFVAGAHMGVQFHPEATLRVASDWASGPQGAGQLEQVGLDHERLERDHLRHARASREMAFSLFDAFSARAAEARWTGSPP